MILCFTTAYYGINNLWGKEVSFLGMEPRKPVYYAAIVLGIFLINGAI